MKILHVIHSLDPENGGTTACVSQIAMIMTQRGHIIDVATLGDIETAPWIASFPAKVHCLGPSILKYAINLRFLRWLHKNAESYDLVIVNGIWQFSGLATSTVMKKKRRPYIVFIHGMLGPYGKRNRWTFFKKWLYWTWAERSVLRNATAAVFTSEEEAHLAENFFSGRYWQPVVLGNSVDKPEMPKDDAIRLFLQRFPEIQFKTILVFIGRIHPVKGCDTLLKAFANVFGQEKTFHLVMVGPASEPAYLETLHRIVSSTGIGDQITWTGHLSPPERNVALSLASVFVSPSHHENFGIAIVEAVAYGVPVILTDKVNIHSILGDAKAAIVCPDSERGLSDALSFWKDLPAREVDAMKNRQLAVWQEKFSPESVANELERQLLALANR